jgi:hypothetical protein
MDHCITTPPPDTQVIDDSGRLKNSFVLYWISK